MAVRGRLLAITLLFPHPTPLGDGIVGSVFSMLTICNDSFSSNFSSSALASLPLCPCSLFLILLFTTCSDCPLPLPAYHLARMRALYSFSSTQLRDTDYLLYSHLTVPSLSLFTSNALPYELFQLLRHLLSCRCLLRWTASRKHSWAFYIPRISWMEPDFFFSLLFERLFTAPLSNRLATLLINSFALFTF